MGVPLIVLESPYRSIMRPFLDFLDEVIRTIRESESAEAARTHLVTRFNLSELQAQAILDLQLRRLAALERGVKAGVGTLDQGLASLDTARRRDYDFARSLVRLPPIDATAIGWVLFGPEAVHKFQRALYYTQLGRAYMPPGLLPRAHLGMELPERQPGFGVARIQCGGPGEPTRSLVRPAAQPHPEIRSVHGGARADD